MSAAKQCSGKLKAVTSQTRYRYLREQVTLQRVVRPGDVFGRAFSLPNPLTDQLDLSDNRYSRQAQRYSERAGTRAYIADHHKRPHAANRVPKFWEVFHFPMSHHKKPTLHWEVRYTSDIAGRALFDRFYTEQEALAASHWLERNFRRHGLAQVAKTVSVSMVNQ